MKWALRRRITTLVISILMIASIILVVALLSVLSNRRGTTTGPFTDRSSNPNSASAVPTPTDKLLIPVLGIKPEQLRDSFAEARSEGRVHDAIDIPAPKGTPVLAAVDGTIIKLAQNDRGGTTIYQLGTDGKFAYYYAHLDRYADGLAEGHFSRQGEVIAYVGDTGNAGAGNYHLHFSVAAISSPKDFWHGVNINPYPLLIK